MKTLIILTTLLGIAFGAHQFKVTNNCGFTVWAGTLGNAGQYAPENGGFQLNSRQSRSFSVSDGWQGRIWPKRSPSAGPPSTLAEFTLDSNGVDWYDVSLVDGFNLPVAIRLMGGTFRRVGGRYDCGNPTCSRDLNNNCPSQLRVTSGGRTVACKSSCYAFNTDQYCCRGAYGQPSTCRTSSWPINSASYFKSNCPDAYSYAYDDGSSTWTCRGNPRTGYEVVFCP